MSNVYSANYSELGDVSDSSGNIKEGLLPDVGDNGNLADAYTPGKLESNRIRITSYNVCYTKLLRVWVKLFVDSVKLLYSSETHNAQKKITKTGS